MIIEKVSHIQSLEVQPGITQIRDGTKIKRSVRARIIIV